MPSISLILQMFQILANTRESQAAMKAMGLLHQMNELYLAGNSPDVRPDVTTYACVINAFTKSRVNNVAELATLVLTEAEEGYQAGLGHLKPNSLLYSAVLQAYAKSSSRSGAALAEQLLRRTKDMYKQGKMYAKPTDLFYNAVIDAHARSNGGLYAAERSEALLDEMESRSNAGDQSLKPNTRSFNAAILAWKHSNATDAPARAEALLRRMDNGNEQCRPDRVTYNTLMSVWATSAEEDAAKRAEEILDFMEYSEASLKPDAWTYNTAILACTRCERKDAAIRAQRLYRRMKRHGQQPDLITLTLLRGIWTNSDDKRASVFLRNIDEEIARRRSAG